MRRVRFYRLILCVALGFFVWNNLGQSSAIVVPLSSVRNAVFYECNVSGKLNVQVIRALETDGCQFRHGTWVNGAVHMTFDGNLKALNKQVELLHKCPAKRVSVCFKPLRQYGLAAMDCAKLYWNLTHIPGKGTFVFTVDTNSPTLSPEKILIPTINRPPMDL